MPFPNLEGRPRVVAYETLRNAWITGKRNNPRLSKAQAASVVDPNSTGHFFYARRSALWNFKSMRQVSGSSLPSLS